MVTSSPYPFYFYNYSLTSYQTRVPSIAICTFGSYPAISQLAGPERSGLSFSVRCPSNKSTNAILTFLLGLDWTAYNWVSFTFQFLASSRDDLEAGQFLAGTNRGDIDLSGLVEGEAQEVSFKVNDSTIQGKMVLFVSGLHIGLGKANPGDGYEVGVQVLGVQGEDAGVRVRRNGNCQVDYMWISYVRYDDFNPNLTIVSGSYSSTPPSSSFPFDPSSKLYTLSGGSLYGVSSF